jgi:hypothetical protein
MGCVSGGYEFVEVRVCGGRARGWCEKCNSLLFGSVCEDIIDRRTDRHVILVAG